MNLLRKLIDKLRRRATPPPPLVIHTKWGDTTEWARAQAARNMKADTGLRAAIEELLAEELGSEAAGLAEARRRYPEAYRED